MSLLGLMDRGLKHLAGLTVQAAISQHGLVNNPKDASDQGLSWPDLTRALSILRGKSKRGL